MAKNFMDLKVWQRSFDLVKATYEVTKSFPKTEIYGLSQQLRRASISVPSNIAEGFRRYHNKEYRQFLYISLGSCAELETQIRIAHELGYVEKEKTDSIITTIGHICGMLTNLIKKL